MASLIGEGNYGCVFKPHVKCDGQKTKHKKAVGKVFVDQKEFENEMNINGVVDSIDPHHEFSIPLVDSCEVKRFTKKDQAKGCSLILNDLDKYSLTHYHQLIYKDGGKDVKTILAQKGSLSRFSKMMKAMAPIFVGIQKLIEKGYVHQDIKPHNLLYDGSKLHLIDFGLLKPGTHIFQKNNAHVLSYDYPYYPPEFKLFTTPKGGINPLYLKVMKNFNFNFIISGKTVDLLDVIQNTLKVDMKDGLKYLIQNRKKAYRWEKIDIYSLGIVLLHLFIWSGLHRKEYKTNTSGKRFQAKIKILLKGMLEFDVAKRFTIEQTIECYNEAIVFLK